MRTETYTYTKNIYTLDEVKEKAIDANWDINVDYEWWQCVYEDAADIGLYLNGFDVGRNRHCTGELLASGKETADRIIANHGETCDTYKLAKDFLAEAEPLIIWLQRVDESQYDLFSKRCVANTYHEKENNLEELEYEFKRDLLTEYAAILQEDYYYRISTKAIEETLRANGYEFNENGTIA